MKLFITALATTALVLSASYSTAQELTVAQKKAKIEKEKVCSQYLSNMEYQLSRLDIKDLIRYSAQMNNFDAWKWPYFAKRCDSEKYVEMLERYNSKMNKVHSKYR